jgi:hypothetical protein
MTEVRMIVTDNKTGKVEERVLELTGVLELTDEQLAELESAGAIVHPCLMPVVEEHRKKS